MGIDWPHLVCNYLQCASLQHSETCQFAPMWTEETVYHLNCSDSQYFHVNRCFFPLQDMIPPRISKWLCRSASLWYHQQLIWWRVVSSQWKETTVVYILNSSPSNNAEHRTWTVSCILAPEWLLTRFRSCVANSSMLQHTILKTYKHTERESCPF